MKRMLCMILAISLLLCLYGCGGEKAPKDTKPTMKDKAPALNDIDAPEDAPVFEPAANRKPGTYGYVLTKEGTIKDEGKDILFQYDALIRSDGTNNTILGCLGQDNNDLNAVNVEYLGNGAYAVKSAKDDVNSVGLLSEDGVLLIPDEACKISWPSSVNSRTDRYLTVIYITGETNNSDECFVYATDRLFSLTPEAGDKMYTGYSRVYDLVNRKFVDNVTITNSDSFAMQPCGENFFVTDKEGISVLYNDKGENLFQTAHRVRVGNGTFVVNDEGTYKVYDENASLTYTSDISLEIIEGDGGYIYKHENNKCVILDRNGNSVGNIAVDSIHEEINGVFKVKDNDKYGLIGADGKVILPCEQYDNVTHLGADMYMSYVSSGSGDVYTLINKDGIIAEGINSSGIYDLVLMDGETAFVINDGTFSLALDEEYPQRLMLGLVAAESDANGMYGVFDLFSGEQLLGYEYDAIEVAADCIYAYKDGEWTVFRVSGPEN